jgi:hypothetical protein
MLHARYVGVPFTHVAHACVTHGRLSLKQPGQTHHEFNVPTFLIDIRALQALMTPGVTAVAAGWAQR